MSQPYIQVLIDGPLAGSFVYACPEGVAVPERQWVTVPWGKGRRTGLALGPCGAGQLPEGLTPEDIRALDGIREDLPTLPADWLPFLAFVARYYHGKLADLALSCLPKPLRTPPTERSRTDARKRLAKFFETPALPTAASARAPDISDLESASDGHGTLLSSDPETSSPHPISLNAAQAAVLQALIEDAETPPRPWLLHGITGSGKTEVYLHWIAHLLDARPDTQVLLMVPEIGLTPAVLTQLQRRFPAEAIAVLHSEMTDAARAAHWMAAVTGTARIILGTRLAVLAPLPHLRAILIDEEHDPSYKQQEGLRYSARDMAVARAKLGAFPILLGSATPSLESWQNTRKGRYRLLSMQQRASTQGGLPRIRTVDLRGAKLQEGLSEESLKAIQQTLARQEQTLIFLNRRGYAPVLGCDACGWLSRCDRCDAYRVLHRQSQAGSAAGPKRYQLICHHCGTCRPVPRACPDCGNQDLAPLGRGTQKLEDALSSLFPSARIGRLDRDVARRRGATEAFLAAAHAGETDLLVGTQMLTKGHDFDRLTLVIVVDADAGLFTADFRAPERLFATLMQVAGRAGRHRSEHAQTIIQTRHPDHPLFEALRRHDYPSFAQAQLAEREAGALPPFGYQALIQVQARQMDHALAFLNDVREYLLSLESRENLLHAHSHGQGQGQGNGSMADADQHREPGTYPRAHDHAGNDGSAHDSAAALAQVNICDPVPMPLAQINKVSRAQLLIESNHRQRLHSLLGELQDWLDTPRPGRRGSKAETPSSGAPVPPTHTHSGVRWHLIVDPQEI